MTQTTPSAATRLAASSRRPELLALAAWTVLVGLSAGINIQNHRNDALIHARFVADAYIDKDLAVRRWITGHGGVYVRPSEKTPPNEWLTVPGRDVVTTTGVALTLVNPAYATRQLMEEFAASNGIRGHLTALRLKNPNNAPDAWEAGVLKRMNAGEKAVVEAVEQDGGPVLRMMRPVYMEQGCMKCHSDMAIPIGGLRGGISVAVPMGPFLAGEQEAISGVLASHGVIWLVGLAGIGWNGRRSREQQRERLQVALLAGREDRRIAEVLSLSERLDSLNEREIIQEGLEVGVALTDSRIGYFHFVNEDQNSIELVTWSKGTLENYCKAAYDNHYPIEKAGIWADCARMHQPVVHNDYPAMTIKRGLPDGHAELLRHMSVPVIEGGRVRIITGVGNKEAPYDENDVRLFQLLANDIWKLVQRKRADTELRKNERRLREAQEVARLGTWEVDLRDNSIEWSEETCRIFGQDPARFRPSQERFVALVHPEDRARVLAATQEAIAQRKEYRLSHRLLLDNGEVRHVVARGQAFHADDGTPVRMVGTIQDMTEQREVEKLRQVQTDLTALFEHTDRLIWSIDSQCRLVVGNSLFLDGMKQLIGRVVTTGEILPPADMEAGMAETWRGYYARALAAEKFSADMEVQGAAGSRWIDFSFTPIIDDETGAVSGVTITGRDYTERRELEESQLRTLERMAHMMRELENHHHKSLLINRLNDLLQSCRNEAEAYDVISLLAAEIFAGQAGCLALLGVEGQELRRVSCWGHDPCTRLSFTVDDCWALRRGEAHEVLHPGELVCAHFDSPPADGYLCLPLVVRGETLGLLNLEYPPKASAELLQELKDTLHSVAETIKLALSNLRLRVALQEQATHDSLTGLYNRRYLDETLRRELHRLERHGGGLTVAMLDIDHFKRFNDSMGHEAGDLVLREIGKLLRENLRKSDIGCRYGGEELLLIFLDSSVADARGRLADICEQIRAMQIPYRGGHLPQVTVSVGISTTGPGHEDAVTLLRAADAALYQAKKSGRDRIVVGGDPLAAT